MEALNPSRIYSEHQDVVQYDLTIDVVS